jgi:hypothetical protein
MADHIRREKKFDIETDCFVLLHDTSNSPTGGVHEDILVPCLPKEKTEQVSVWASFLREAFIGVSEYEKQKHQCCSVVTAVAPDRTSAFPFQIRFISRSGDLFY